MQHLIRDKNEISKVNQDIISHREKNILDEYIQLKFNQTQKI